MVLAQRVEIERLEHNVEVFRRMAFGPSTEKRHASTEVPEDARQGSLFYAELVEEAQRTAAAKGVEGTIEVKAEGKPKKKGGRRKKFPDHAPVVRTTYELPKSDRVCSCGGDLHEIGVDVRKELERVEVTVVHEIARTKYGCRKCTNGVRTAAAPDRVIAKGIMGKGFLAQVITDRFQNHMPYYRLAKQYASEGLELNRSVLQRSMATVGELLEPIWRRLQKDVMSSPVIHTDDTGVRLVTRGTAGSKSGHVWIYLDQEGRHFYDFTESRGDEGPLKILKDYSGYIHADAFPGYNQVFTPDGATEVGCWAHTRRYFVKAEASDPDLAKEAIDQIRELFLIERAGKDLEADALRDLRMNKAQPRLLAFKAWLELTATRVLPQSPMAAAITYTLNQWDALIRYLEDGRLRLDNNAAERAMRPIAVGRKNWLFYQSDTGGRTAVILMSLLESAKAAGADPRTYFRDVLTRIATESDVGKLTPHGWMAHFAEEAAERREQALRSICASL